MKSDSGALSPPGRELRGAILSDLSIFLLSRGKGINMSSLKRWVGVFL